MSLSLALLLAESARKYPDRTAVVLGEERVTYARLWNEARQVAVMLRDEYGVRAGNAVALLMPNVIDFPRAYYAVLALGAVVVPVHALLTPEEIEYVLRDSGAKLLIAHPMLPNGAAGAQRAGIPVVHCQDEVPSRHSEDPSCHPEVSKDPERGRGAFQIAPRDEGDDAVILYTSGTTGKPKGAVLTHLNMVMNATVSAFDLFEAREGDVLLCALPLFHSFGQTCVMNTGFRTGCTIVLMPRFDGAAALDLMVRERVTCFAGVPTMYIALLEAAKNDPRRPPLRRLNSGGAALPVAILERVEATFGVQVEEGYGLSETSPVATFNQRAIGVKPGTVGTPIWGVEVAIAKADVDDRVELLPPGERGEIVIRGHCVFSRYLNNPQATAAAKVDGWFRSGDIGALDDDGFVTILDRKKDLILRGGFNVYPREVEEVLLRHPAIAQAAVIGVPHDVQGEEVCAVIIRAEHAQGIQSEEIVVWARENMAKHKYPRIVEFIDAFPLGPSGKVLKRELVARYTKELR
ncbi:MAG TPA: long-chain fatty acid--CoA ligase [Candidatus Baltobacteraceae bacterium]|nr:long-chain fatty acid--CoA ligase [Candidatus Baltobacteraceae bacterium]